MGIERAQTYGQAHQHPRGRGARLVGLCLVAAALLWAASASAQQVLLAPTVDLQFDSLTLAGQLNKLTVSYQLSKNDWQWTRDMGFDVWVGVYKRAGNGAWVPEKVQRLDKRSGKASLAASGAGPWGICLVAATDGGRLAPGMGYTCQKPVLVPASAAPITWTKQNATVALAYQAHVDQQPWYNKQTGFRNAGAQPTAVSTTGGGFISYVAPSPAVTSQPASPGAYAQGYGERPRYQRGEGASGYPADFYGGYYDYYGYGGYFPGEINRFNYDFFRHRRLQRQRMFPPLGGFDAQFNQDMFTTHPDDVFYSFPIMPGYFGRDAFGRRLDNGFGPIAPQRGFGPRPGFNAPGGFEPRGVGGGPAQPRGAPGPLPGGHGVGMSPGLR